MADVQFEVEPHPTQQKRWRVVRVEGGERTPLVGSTFRKTTTAAKHAYTLQVQYEQRQRRIASPYLGD